MRVFSQRGLGLIELMISLVLAGLLLALCMQHYLLSKRHTKLLATFLGQQLELHLVIGLLRNSLRQAGFTPCASLESLHTKDSLTAIDTDSKNILKINRMNENFTRILQSLSPRQLLVGQGVSFTVGQRVLIADCYHAEVGQIRSLAPGPGGTWVELHNAQHFNYVAPVYLGEWLEEVFFIRKNAEGRGALFYHHRHSEELSPVIKQLSATQRLLQGKRLVDLKLTLDSEELTLTTAVRNP
jgi:prepilin-type N-terminal cleavage/methylation domain-containing protein